MNNLTEALTLFDETGEEVFEGHLELDGDLKSLLHIKEL